MKQTALGSESAQPLQRAARELLRGLREEVSSLRRRDSGEIGTVLETVALSDSRPLYHEKLLIVKLRAEIPETQVKAIGATMAAGGWTTPGLSPGLRLLSDLERGGYIRRAVSLSPVPSAEADPEI